MSLFRAKASFQEYKAEFERDEEAEEMISAMKGTLDIVGSVQLLVRTIVSSQYPSPHHSESGNNGHRDASLSDVARSFGRLLALFK